MAAPSKRSSLVLPVEKKRRQIYMTSIKEIDEKGTGRPRAPQALQVSKIPSSARRTVQF